MGQQRLTFQGRILHCICALHSKCTLLSQVSNSQYKQPAPMEELETEAVRFLIAGAGMGPSDHAALVERLRSARRST